MFLFIKVLFIILENVFHLLHAASHMSSLHSPTDGPQELVWRFHQGAQLLGHPGPKNRPPLSEWANLTSEQLNFDSRKSYPIV